MIDEVMTSSMSAGGLQARLGLRPDLTTLGKYIGGGMSLRRVRQLGERNAIV